MELPCGKCHDCLSRRISGWSFRLRQQEKVSESAHFVTLTYNTDHVPITGRGFMSLDKSDPQKFFKRLRKHATKRNKNHSKISYFLCGEYGEKTNRPHYHAIIYNANILDIEKAWPLGDIHVGQVSAASIGYTLKYMCKTPSNQIPKHKNDDRQPIFQLMSKALGANYLTSTTKSWHKRNLTERSYIPIEDGKRIVMPRYYKNILYSKHEREHIQKAHLKRIEQQPQITEQDRLQQIEANRIKQSKTNQNRK